MTTGIFHAYTNSVADDTTTGIVHPADWLASHVIAADTELNGLAPVGAVLPWCGTIAAVPDGWMFCNGVSLARTGTYAHLFSMIGTVWGAADGSHFNIPNLFDEFIVGARQDSGGKAMASITGVLTQSFAPGTLTLTHGGTVAAHAGLTHTGMAIAAHTGLTHGGAVSGHPATSPTLSIAGHGRVTNIGKTTKTASRTSAASSSVHSNTDLAVPSRSHNITASLTSHADLTHSITDANAHGAAGTVTHSFTAATQHTFQPAAAFLALAYIIRCI